MEKIDNCLINFASFELDGTERSCLLKDEPINGYLSVGSIIPHISLGTKFIMTGDHVTKRPLKPGKFEIGFILRDVTLGDLHDMIYPSQTKEYIEQEQITASISKCEDIILPRPYLDILGYFSAVFFFKESERIFVAIFTTSANGNECEVRELDDVVKKFDIDKRHTTLSRVIFPK